MKRSTDRAWLVRAKGVVLQKTDPVHQLYFRVKYLKGLEDLTRSHLELVMAKYLPVGGQDMTERMFIRAALHCYIQSALLEDQLWAMKPGTDTYRAVAVQVRAWYEAMAKSYRLKGMKEPGRHPKSKGTAPVRKRIDLTAAPFAEGRR